MRKSFKVYQFVYEYYVLKCPHCNFVFRFNEQKNNKSTIAKCQKCNKRFTIDKNTLSEDVLGKPWEDAIILSDNKIEKIDFKKKTKVLNKLPNFITADKIVKRIDYIG